MKTMDNIIEGFAQRAHTRERKAAVKSHKLGTEQRGRGQRFADRVETMFGSRGTWTAERTRGVLEGLGGHVANKRESELLEGYNYTDSTGSTQRVSGIREDDLSGLISSRESIIAERVAAAQEAARAKGRTLDPGEIAAIEAKRPDIFRDLTSNYLHQLSRSQDPVMRRKAEVIKNQILEHTLESRYALGLDQNDPAEQAFHNEAAEFLKIADKHFAEARLNELRKKYRKRFGGPLAVLASMVIDTVKLGTSSAPIKQHA